MSASSRRLVGKFLIIPINLRKIMTNFVPSTSNKSQNNKSIFNEYIPTPERSLPYLRHQHGRAFQLLRHACHLHSVPHPGTPFRQGARRLHLRQLHRTGVPDTLNRRLHRRQILGHPPFRLLGGHDDGSRPVPDVCQCLDAGGA